MRFVGEFASGHGAAAVSSISFAYFALQRERGVV